MANEIICENCGARCSIEDKHCKNCWEKIPETAKIIEQPLHGMEKSAWLSFLEVRSNRYLKVFKKYEKKKFFIHLNFAALLLGVNWLIYRKMYKIAIIFASICVMVSCLSMLGTAMYYKEDIDACVATIEKYDNTYDDYDEYTEGSENIEKAREKIFGILYKMEMASVVAVPFELLTLGFLGDFLYRTHTIKCMEKGKGGGTASYGATVGIRMLLIAISNAITVPFSSILFSIMS